MGISATERRRRLAGQITGPLAALRGASCVFVIGSVATGDADDRSDLDIVVVTGTEIPNRSDRHGTLSRLGGRWTLNDPPMGNPVFAEVDRTTGIEGVPIEIHYQTKRVYESVLEQVFRAGAITTPEIPFRPYTVAAMFQQAWVMSDRDGLPGRGPWHGTRRFCSGTS